MKRAIEACPWKYQEQWAEHMIAYSDKEEYPCPAQALKVEGLLSPSEQMNSIGHVEDILGLDYYGCFGNKKKTKELLALIDHKLSRKI